jgi:hypothetical protein
MTPLIAPSLIIRCADCHRVTGKGARIGTVMAWHSDSAADVIIFTSGVGSSKSQNRHPAQACIEWINGHQSIRYFCRRCERRTGRIAYKVIPTTWFLERFAEMPENQKTRTLTI